MALLVDPPSRDSADERPPAGVSSSAAAEEAGAVPDSPVITEPLLAPEPAEPEAGRAQACGAPADRGPRRGPHGQGHPGPLA